MVGNWIRKANFQSYSEFPTYREFALDPENTWGSRIPIDVFGFPAAVGSSKKTRKRLEIGKVANFLSYFE